MGRDVVGGGGSRAGSVGGAKVGVEWSRNTAWKRWESETGSAVETRERQDQGSSDLSSKSDQNKQPANMCQLIHLDISAAGL